jgi:predicted dehydrogenase
MPLRIIQAGIGGHGRTWLTLLQRESADGDAIELVAVADPSEWARTVAAEDGIPATQIFATLDEALRFVEADAVLVVTPPATHRALATAALEVGKHVLIEKPLATTIEDARALANLASERGLTLMVSQNYRHQAPVRALRRLLDSGGDYGVPVAIEITFMKDSRAMWPADNFRYAMDHPLLLDMSIHHLDMLRAITGRNATSIAVESWRVLDSPYEGDVALAALIRLEGDLPVVYRGNWASVGPQTTWNGDWRILTDRGRLAWVGWAGQDHEDQLTWEAFDCRAKPQVLRQEPLAQGGFAGSLHAFVEAVTTGTEPETSAVDNLHSLAMLFAGVASAERGGSVAIG